MAGATPTRTSLKPKVAASGATAMSAAAINPSPPARAAPFTRAITGTGHSARVRRISGMRLGAAVPRSERSAPEQNTVPAPVSTTTRTAGSSADCRSAAASSSSRRDERALRFEGESSVTVRTPSLSCAPSSTRTSGSPTDGECRGASRRGSAKFRRWYRGPVIETDEHQLFRKTLRDVFEREIEPYVDEWEAARTFPAHELFPKLGAIGLFGLEYEEVYGGMAADHTFTMIAGEELGRVSCGGVPMAIAVQMAMATPALARYGSPELKEMYLAPAIRGEVVTSIAVTEPDAGSDVAGIRTRAVRDGDQWVINGSKLFITNGTQADWLCLLARTSDEPGGRAMSLIVVPTALEGVAVSRKLEKLGMWSSDTAELSFSDVRVPLANTIGEVGRGFQHQMVQFQGERLITFYKQIGSIELALDRTRQYLRDRHAFGAPLLANQHLQFVLAELSARHDVLKHYARTAADVVRRGEDATRYATIGKLLGSRLQREVADWAVQFHGGMGYMDENWTSRDFRDTRLDSIGAGADEVMLRILARMDGYEVN